MNLIRWVVMAVVVLGLVGALAVVYRMFAFGPAARLRPALVKAVIAGSVPEAERLLAGGANANESMDWALKILPGGQIGGEIERPHFGSAPMRGGTPLLAWAASRGDPELLRALLAHGAEVNRADRFGQTALIMAAWSGDAECVRLLLEHGADRNAKDKTGKTALAWARAEGNKGAAALLK